MFNKTHHSVEYTQPLQRSHPLFVFAILPYQLQEKPSYIYVRRNYLFALSALRNTSVFVDSRVNLTTKVAVVNFPSADWLSYLTIQLKAFVGGVCLPSKRFFLALFLY